MQYGEITVLDLLERLINEMTEITITSIKKVLVPRIMKEIKDSVYEGEHKRLRNVELIIACKNRAYNISENFTVTEIDKMYIMGSGSDTAYGSLYTSQYLSITPEERVMLAIKAAGHRNLHVSKEAFIGDTIGQTFKEYGRMKNDKI